MRWTLALFLAACSFERSGGGGGTPDGSSPGDDIDAPPNVCATSFSALVDTCTATFGPAVSLSAAADEYRYNTDSHQLESCTNSNLMLVPGSDCQTIATPTNTVVNGVEVWLVESFTLADVPFTVSGAHPFAIVASGTIAIAGQIDMQAGNRTTAQCGARAGLNGTANANGGGGGGGGGFQRGGQVGGDGGAAGGGGGGTEALPATLIGGCPGGDGGGGPNSPVAGGPGGGALHLASATDVTIASGGRINAGGRGGRGARSDQGKGGGSGGGSGGLIWIQAAMVDVAGALAANGGAAGEGSSGSNDGRSGARGDVTNTPAKGGAGGDSNGGDGGDGDAGATAPSSMQGQARDSGGGGGGGVGYIRIVGARTGNGTITPPAL